MAITVRYHDEIAKLQGLAGLARGPFDRAEWFALLAAAGVRLEVAEAYEGDRAAALVLARGAHGLEAARNWFAFTWRPLAPDGAAGDALLGAIARDLRDRTHRLDLWPLPDEDGSATRLAAAFRAAGWRVTLEPCDENHVLPVAGRSFADYWAARPGALRTTLKRKGGKVETEILTRFDEAAWRAYQDIYAQSWKPHEAQADLLAAFARAEGAAGRLRLGLARAGGAVVAAQFWSVEDGTAYIHKLAHNDAGKALSAGTTLSAALFRHVIDADRVDLVDFGTGRDGYKRDWMEEVRPRFRLTALDPRSPRAWPALARIALRPLARALRRR